MAETHEEVRVEDEFLIHRDTLLSSGVHIGTRTKTKNMEKFIYRVRPDGLFVLNIKRTDERIRVAAKFLARFEPQKVAVVAGRLYAKVPAEKFCEFTKTTPILGRFIPGSFSNPLYPMNMEPDVILVSDPKADSQAVEEASILGIPVVALCSADNDLANIDLAIPANNKGRKSLAVVFWLLARQILRERGDLPPDGDLPASLESFEVKLVTEEEEPEETPESESSTEPEGEEPQEKL